MLSCSHDRVSDPQGLFLQRQAGSGRSRVGTAKRGPCSTDSHWDLPGCRSPELRGGKFNSGAEFASLGSLVPLQPSVFQPARVFPCYAAVLAVPLVMADPLADGIIDNAVARL